MKSYSDLFHMLSGRLPRRHRPGDWIVPTAIGLGLGIAAGVGIGVLLAPASGLETRRELRRKTSELKERARHAAIEAKEKVTHLKAAAVTNAPRLADIVNQAR